MAEGTATKIEIEIDENGKFGPLPEPIQRLVNNQIAEGKKAARAEIVALQAKLESAGGLSAAERERLAALEDDNTRYKTADAERKAEYEKALKIREEAEAKREEERKKESDLTKAEIARRDARLREMARSEIKIAARRLGARDGSLDELSEILGKDIDLDADLQPFIKGSDGKVAVDAAGKPVTIEGFVKAYLDRPDKSHHRASAGGTGGGARGGASFNGADPTEVEKAEKALEEAQKTYRKNRSDMAALSRVNDAKKKLDDVKAGKTTK